MFAVLFIADFALLARLHTRPRIDVEPELASVPLTHGLRPAPKTGEQRGTDDTASGSPRTESARHGREVRPYTQAHAPAPPPTPARAPKTSRTIASGEPGGCHVLRDKGSAAPADSPARSGGMRSRGPCGASRESRATSNDGSVVAAPPWPGNLAAGSAPPAALLSGETKRATILALSPAARAAGVECGMTAPQALARCATLELLTPDSAAEAEAQAMLLAAAWQLSANVESTAPGVATADLTALDDARREPLARAAVAELAALGLPATAGLARTPLLALYAARHAACGEHRGPGPAAAAGLAAPYAEPSVETSESHGRVEEAPATVSPRRTNSPPPSVAANQVPATCGHCPILVVRDDHAFLAPLPLAVAGPSAELAEILAAWGVRTLGEFAALGKRAVARRLGAEGVALWERARGETSRPLRLATPPSEFAAAMDFENEVETLEPLLFVLRRFVERLALELRAASFVAAELKLTLRLADATAHARAFRLPEPTGDVETLFRSLHTHLESLHTATAIAGVQLRLEPVRPLVRQRGLFESELRDPHGFAETLARTVALVGSGRVGAPLCADTHRPDSFVVVPPAPVVPPPAPPPVHAAEGLPLRRFRPPLAATVELEGRAPAFVWCERVRGAVHDVRGPWRGAGDWWQPDQTWEREEWDVALETGGLYRVVHTPDGWFVEGEYD